MKTSELTGAALDWAVARAEGAYAPSIHTDADGTCCVNYGGMFPEWSTNWAQGGPIIEREKISAIWMQFSDEQYWVASIDNPEREAYGPTPLIAAMRCYVASKLGDEVEIPEEVKC